MPDATPLKFTTPENDTKIADFITLTPCSVKLMREPIPAESRIITRERAGSDASNYSKFTLDSQGTIIDSPPRLAASTPSESSLTADSAKSADSVDVVSSKDTDKPNLNTVAGKPDSNAEERVEDYETESLETKSNAGLSSAQSNVPESTNVLNNGIDTPVRPERNTQKNKFGVSPSPSRMQVLSPSRAQVSCLSGFISFYFWWFILGSLHN